MTNEELKQRIRQEAKHDFKDCVESELFYMDILRDMGYTIDQAISIMIWLELKELNNELSGYGEFESVSESLSTLSSCVGYVPPTVLQKEGYHILRIGGHIDTSN